MPRIQAPTIAEQRAQRQRAILDATRSLLIEKREAPTMGEIGLRAGISRSGVYQYFDSVESVLSAVAAEVFPAWISAVHDRVEAATSAGEKVWAYIEGNFASFADPNLEVTQVLVKVMAPRDLHTPMKTFHLQLQVPLREALVALQEPAPEMMASFIDSLILKATHEPGYEVPFNETEARNTSLNGLRRLLGPYLGLTP